MFYIGVGIVLGAIGGWIYESKREAQLAAAAETLNAVKREETDASSKAEAETA